MLGKETIIRRLAISKYLYKMGLVQSQQPESIAFACLLSFHDAIEIFLKLVAEKQNIKSDNFRFLEYWDKVPSLTMKESMGNLNLRRVNLKHKGILPAKQDLEISRVNVTDFFEQNTKQQFGIDFKEISLINLVTNVEVRVFLEKAQTNLDENNYSGSIENSAYAFFNLLEVYEKNKTNFYQQSPFSFGDKAKTWAFSYNKISDIDRDLGDHLTAIISSVEALKESVKIICLGLDYKKYSMFRLLTPSVSKWNEELRAELYQDRKWTIINCQFCIDFVIESSLKLQELDFDINHLINDEPLTLEYDDIHFDTKGFFNDATGNPDK
jgi:hypothetical protein